MPDILDKIFCDKKIELDTVKRKLALPDVKMRIANNNYEVRDIRMLLESTKDHLLLQKSNLVLHLKVNF